MLFLRGGLAGAWRLVSGSESELLLLLSKDRPRFRVPRVRGFLTFLSGVGTTKVCMGSFRSIWSSKLTCFLHPAFLTGAFERTIVGVKV